jgi:hypothetical protein
MYLEADAPRVDCPEHGVVVAAVPWAWHGSRFTVTFEDTCAWLACHAALSVLSVLLRVTWRAVSAIVVRVVAEAAGRRDRLAGLRRIGVNEISSRSIKVNIMRTAGYPSHRLAKIKCYDRLRVGARATSRSLLVLGFVTLSDELWNTAALVFPAQSTLSLKCSL